MASVLWAGRVKWKPSCLLFATPCPLPRCLFLRYRLQSGFIYRWLRSLRFLLKEWSSSIILGRQLTRWTLYHKGDFSFRDILPCAFIPPKTRLFVASVFPHRCILFFKVLNGIFVWGSLPGVTVQSFASSGRCWPTFQVSSTVLTCCQVSTVAYFALFGNVPSRPPSPFASFCVSSCPHSPAVRILCQHCDVFVFSPVASTRRIVLLYLEL
jgi:hypothetical protein